MRRLIAQASALLLIAVGITACNEAKDTVHQFTHPDSGSGGTGGVDSGIQVDRDLGGRIGDVGAGGIGGQPDDDVGAGGQPDDDVGAGGHPDDDMGAGGIGGQPGDDAGAGGIGGGVVPPAGQLGAPCESDDECEGGRCIALPEGYCSQACSDNEPCPEGGSCWPFQDGTHACLLNCEAHAECRVADGYICDSDSTCYPGRIPVPPGDGEIGGPCVDEGDCGEGMTCIVEGFTDGYCAQFGCDENNPCPAGSECFGLQDDRSVCLDLCAGRDECRDTYACRPDVGACLPGCVDNEECGEGNFCNEDLICEPEPCTPESCEEGLICADSGVCVIDIGQPPPGPIPECLNMPSWECEGGEANCGELILFLPSMGAGYWDYPANGETEDNPYRSWSRRDVVMLNKYAAAWTECLTQNWDFANGGLMGIGDCSEEDGSIPGTSIGSPGHPEGTHTNGYDLDAGYFQVNTRNNWMRPICEHTVNGQEQYHCVGPPTLLDPWRTAIYLAKLHDSPQLRVIGVDGQVGPLIDSAMDQLCEAGWLDGPACDRRSRSVTYEVENENRGWFRFHHHHWHMSATSRRSAGLNLTFGPLRGADACITADCREVVWPTRLRRLPLSLDTRLKLSKPVNVGIAARWSPEQVQLFREIQRLDLDD